RPSPDEVAAGLAEMGGLGEGERELERGAGEEAAGGALEDGAAGRAQAPRPVREHVTEAARQVAGLRAVRHVLDAASRALDEGAHRRRREVREVARVVVARPVRPEEAGAEP